MRILGAILIIACATHSCTLPPPALSGVVAFDLRAERMLCETVSHATDLGLLPRSIAREAPCYRAALDEGFALPACLSSAGWQGIPLGPQ
jgi:hypothetical protein